MAYHRVEDGPWPVGTTVAAYPAASVTGGLPVGPPTSVAVASANGVAEYGGLTEGQDYTAFGHGGIQTFRAINEEAALEPLQDAIAALEASVAGLQAGTATLVSVLPGSPADGQEVYFIADSANGVIWHLRYRTAGTAPYRWEFVGGSSLRGAITGGGSARTGTGLSTFALLSGVSGPVAPLSGIYEASTGAVSFVSSSDTLQEIRLQFAADSSGTLARVLGGLAPYHQSATGGVIRIAATLAERVELNASEKLSVAWSAGAGAQFQTFLDSALFCRPVRVG